MFSSQQLHGGSKSSVTPLLRDSPFSDLIQAQTQCTYIHTGKILIDIKYINKPFFF